MLKPLHHYVIIRRLERKTKSKIITPDAFDTVIVPYGEVVAAGPGRYDGVGGLIPVAVKPGDKVIYYMGATTRVSLEDKDLIIIPDTDIFVIEDDKPEISSNVKVIDKSGNGVTNEVPADYEPEV